VGFRSLSIDRSSALGLLFLVVGILLPTASVLWFMNEAMTAQLAQARQEVTDAYRGQLRLIAEQIATRWRARADVLAVDSPETAAEAFARLVTAGHADAVIVADADGALAYPRRPSASADLAETPAWRTPGFNRAQAFEMEQQFAEAAVEYATLADAVEMPTIAAPAAQGAIRSLLRQGDTDAAIGLIEQFFVERDLSRARDPFGRHIAADEWLLLIELLPDADPRQAATVEKLIALLNDYTVEMPAAQRLFLMEALGAMARAPVPGATAPSEMAPDATESLFPTYRGERLAQEYLTTASAIDPGAAALQATRMPGIWRLSFADGQGVALFRLESIAAGIEDLLAGESGGVAFAFVPPGESPGTEAFAAPVLLPGWQIGFTLEAAAFEAAASSRRVYYTWVGALVVAVIAVAGLVLFGTYRHQIRIAALKTDLVAAVSHELRTPLASMRLLVDTLLEHGTADERRTHEYLELVARENARLARLIESFLEFSRLDRRKRQFDFESTEPASVVEAAVAAVRERFEQAGCGLDLAVEQGLPAVDADREALAIALVNLLDNALKYTRDDRRIVLRAMREGAQVVFAVIDNGIGIHAQDQKRIFRRFFQMDRRLSRETGGVGLGLSIVDLIVRAHRGSVQIESRPGSGSTFSVRLPARAAA
jgi:signal transduction histidine kinase